MGKVLKKSRLATVVAILLTAWIVHFWVAQPSAGDGPQGNNALAKQENIPNAGASEATQQAKIASEPLKVARPGIDLHIRETIGQRANRLVKSSRPEERFKGYKLLARCAELQQVLPILAKDQPQNATQLYYEMNIACEGVDVGLLVKRKELISELLELGIPGVSEAFALDTPGGRPISEVRKDPNQAVWFEKAVKHLVADAKAGDIKAIDYLATLQNGMPGSEYDALMYGVASLHITVVKYPKIVPATEFDGRVRQLQLGASRALDADQISAATSDGIRLGKKATGSVN